MEDPNKDLIANETHFIRDGKLTELLTDTIECEWIKDDKTETVNRILDDFNSIEPPEEEDGYDAIAHEE